MSATTCGWCKRRPASETWDVRPCALGGEGIVLRMCRACDVEMNRLVLGIAGYRGRTKIMQDYRGRR